MTSATLMQSQPLDSRSSGNDGNLSATADESEAARAALEGSLWARLRIAHRALRRLLANVDDTRQVLVLSIALNAKSLPRLLARFIAEDDGLALMSERPAIDSSMVDFDWLRALPETTLGGAYVRFLDKNGLDPDLFQSPPGLPPAIAYLAQRFRQSHDLWHVLTGYSPEVAGELPLLAFSYAQTEMPSFRLLAIVGSIRYAFHARGMFRKVIEGYRRGKRAKFLGAVRWEHLWERPLAEVRADLGIAI